MKKVLAVCCVLAVSIMSQAAALVHPKIVAQYSVTNQTSAITTTTIYTPTVTGLYRLSVYENGTNGADITIHWEDALNPANGFGFSCSSCAGVSGEGFVLPISVTASTPITIETDAPGPSGVYNLFITVERIQ
jgi:hypothetical protein